MGLAEGWVVGLWLDWRLDLGLKFLIKHVLIMQ